MLQETIKNAIPLNKRDCNLHDQIKVYFIVTLEIVLQKIAWRLFYHGKNLKTCFLPVSVPYLADILSSIHFKTKTKLARASN